MPSDGGISIVTLGRESQSWKVSPSRVFGSISLFPAKTPLCAMLYSTKSLQSCPALCDPMDYSPQGSSVHGILQAWILEGVALPYSRGSSQPGDKATCLKSPALADGFFTNSVSWEALRPLYLSLTHHRPSSPSSSTCVVLYVKKLKIFFQIFVCRCIST